MQVTLDGHSSAGEQQHLPGGRRACIFPDLPWGAPPSWGKATKWLTYWELLTGLLCLYVGLKVPYEAGFDQVKGPMYQHFSDCALSQLGIPGYQQIFAIIDLLIDCCFVFDVFINFLTARWIVEREGREHWKLVDDLYTIRQMYVFRCHENGYALVPQFWLDLLGVIPWQYADCTSSSVNVLKNFRIFRLIKLLRLYRIQRLIEALRLYYPQSVFVINTTQLMLCLFLVAHWMCCVWFSFGYHDGGWVHRDGLMEILDGDDGPTLVPIEGLVIYEWLSSFYWAITTMTTIGYGDISAKTISERGIACLVMILGCGFFAWSTGTITYLMTAKPHCEARFKDSLDDLIEFMESNDLPLPLRRKLTDYYALKFPTMRMHDDDAVLGGLPVGLRKEVRTQLFADTLKKSWFFHGITGSAAFGEIANHLTLIFKTEDIAVTTAGEFPDALYFVRKGTLDVYFGGKHIGEARANDVFGESALLGLSRDGRRLRTVTCRTMCELCALSKEHFHELLHSDEIRVPIQRMLHMYFSEIEKLAQGDNLTRENLIMIPWRQLANNLRQRARMNLKSDDLSNTNIPWADLIASSPQSPDSNHNLSWGQNSVMKSPLDTMIRIRVRELRMGDNTLSGIYNIILAVSWPGHVHDNIRSPKKSQVYPTCAWSDTFQVNFTAGRADVTELSHPGSTIPMLLQHEYMPWTSMPGLRVLMYQVQVDAFSPPAGYFPRLDRDDASVEEMVSIEERNGLKLLGIGSVSIGKLIHERDRVTTCDTKKQKNIIDSVGKNVKEFMRKKEIPLVTIPFAPGVYVCVTVLVVAVVDAAADADKNEAWWQRRSPLGSRLLQGASFLLRKRRSRCARLRAAPRHLYS